MEKIILKKATLKNSGVWTTTFIWYSIPENGCTQIVTKQRYEKMKKYNYTHVEQYNNNEFDKAYDDFHNKIKEWI